MGLGLLQLSFVIEVVSLILTILIVGVAFRAQGELTRIRRIASAVAQANGIKLAE